MRCLIQKIQNFLRSPRKRTCLCALLMFLVPVTGWVPIELLWLANLCFLWKDAPRRGMRIFYAILIVFVSALVRWNLTARFFLK